MTESASGAEYSSSQPAVGSDRTTAQTQLSTHILSVSAALVGVCMTVIGLFRIGAGGKRLDTVADDILAVDAVMFLAASMAAYFALRARSTESSRRRESVADALFLVGLSLMVVVAALVAYEFI